MIQPDLLPLLRGDLGRAEFVNDGWADRFLLSFPDPMPLTGETWATVPVALEEAYAAVFETLLGLEMVSETDDTGADCQRPRYIPFDPAAAAAWEDFTNVIAARSNDRHPTDSYVGVLSKLRHYGLRLVTLVYCLRAACGELEDGSPVDGETVRRAAVLVEYFDAHGRRCLGVGWADRSVRVAERLLAWLARTPARTGFNRTEAFIALKDKRDVRTSEALATAFRLLVDHGYIRPLGRPENARPGPVPETYAVNSAWHRPSPDDVPGVPTVKPPTDGPGSNCRDSRDGFRGDPLADNRDEEVFTP